MGDKELTLNDAEDQMCISGKPGALEASCLRAIVSLAMRPLEWSFVVVKASQI
jgi:hypothetical protein